jgi:hypothetical protein
MTALEIRPEEIGVYDYEAVKARRARMFGRPVASKPVVVAKPVVALPARVEKARAVTLYPWPIGPDRTERDWLILSDFVPAPSITMPPRRYPAIKDIISIVAHLYNLSINDLISSRRTVAVARRRQEAMWLAKKFTLKSLPEIGRAFGGRDHTTVLHAIRKIEAMVREGVYEPKAEGFVQMLAEEVTASPRSHRVTLPEPLPPPPPLVALPRRGWTHTEKEQVRALRADGWSILRLAEKLVRSENSVRKAVERYRLDQPAAPALIAAE